MASCFPAGSRGVRVQRCAVEVRARATCTLVEPCVHASMGPWGRGGEMHRAIFSTLRSLKAPSGSCLAGRPFQTSTPRLLHRPGSSP